MKDVVARKFFGSGHHLFTADDAHIVSGLQILRCGIWIESIHVTDGPSRHDGVCYSLLELPHREIHGSNGKQRKGVHFYHYGHECHIQNYLDETCKELRVQHVDSLIVPRVFTLEIDCMQGVFDEGGENHSHQYRILKSKHQLH